MDLSICTVDGKLDCDQKWQHVLKYRRVGVYTVLDGQTVGEFLRYLILFRYL